MKYQFIVNGELVEVDVFENMLFFWVLCDEFDFKGIKFGCGMGQCGVCIVYVDGVVQCICCFVVLKVVGKEIMMIEGLFLDGSYLV